MLRSFGLIAFHIGIVLSFPLHLSAQQDSSQPNAAAILAKIRETYFHLKNYHFEHTILVEEVGKNEQRTKVAEIDFVLAAGDAQRPPANEPGASKFPMSLERCRLEIKGAQEKIVVAADGEEAVMYLESCKQYKRGKNAMHAIGGPTSATMFLALNATPLARFTDNDFEAPKLLREEEATFGKEKKSCYVIEAVVKAPALQVPEGIKRSEVIPEDHNPFAGAAGFLMLLTMHGLPGDKGSAVYLPLRSKDPQLPRITLWIDRNEPIVWKSHLAERVQKTSPKVGLKEEPIEIAIIDTFSVAQLTGPLRKGLLHFNLPEEAKEVSKFDERPASPEKTD